MPTRVVREGEFVGEAPAPAAEPEREPNFLYPERSRSRIFKRERSRRLPFFCTFKEMRYRGGAYKDWPEI